MSELQPIYCYKMIGDISSVHFEKYVITDYVALKQSNGVARYSFRTPRIGSAHKYFIESPAFDRFVNNKAFTFNDDIKFVTKVVTDTIVDKLVEHRRQIEKLERLMTEMPIGHDGNIIIY